MMQEQARRAINLVKEQITKLRREGKLDYPLKTALEAQIKDLERDSKETGVYQGAEIITPLSTKHSRVEFKKLSEMKRAIVVLKLYGDFTSKEVSNLLHIHTTMVEYHWRTVKDKLTT